MKFIFDVYTDSIKGIIEVTASDDQEAINKVNKLGLKFSSMRQDLGIYSIQYTSKYNSRFKI